MALTPTERSICNKLVFDFNALIAPVNASKGTIINATSDIQGLLNTTSFANEATINNAIASFLQDTDDNLPDTSELEELSNLIKNCDYLSDLKPVAIIGSSINTAVDKIDELVDNVGVGLPEFNLGGIASKINDLLFGNIPGSDQISELLSKADKLIECLSTYCGGEYPTQVSDFTTTVNDLYDDLNIVSNPLSSEYGKYDMQSLYDGAGVSAADQSKVTSVINSVDVSKDAATTKINSVVNAIKTNVGGLF